MTIEVPLRKQAYKSYRMSFLENVQMQKVFSDGLVWGYRVSA